MTITKILILHKPTSVCLVPKAQVCVCVREEKQIFFLAQLQYPKSATTIPKTFRKVTVDNFPQWVFSGAKVAELRQCQWDPDSARHPVLDVG